MKRSSRDRRIVSDSWSFCEKAPRYGMSGLLAFCLMPKREQRGFSHEAKDRKRQELVAESGRDRASPTMRQEQT